MRTNNNVQEFRYPLYADDGELMAWDIYFAAIMSIQYHPRADEGTRFSITTCAQLADSMMLERRKRCLSSQR